MLGVGLYLIKFITLAVDPFSAIIASVSASARQNKALFVVQTLLDNFMKTFCGFTRIVLSVRCIIYNGLSLSFALGMKFNVRKEILLMSNNLSSLSLKSEFPLKIFLFKRM